ncbi:MAG: MFS transporter [Nitrososphaerales archaeon]|jgi:MFS family permease
MFRQYSSIPGEAKLLIVLSFVPSFALSFLFTDLSYFLTTVKGLSIVFTGTVYTVMGVSMVAASIPFGILADRYGRRRFIVVGNLLAGVMLALFALTSNTLVLILAAAVEGGTEAAFAAAATALLAEKAGESNRTAAFSLSFFLGNIAWGLSGFAIPLVLVFEHVGLDVAQAHVVLYLILAGLSVAITPLLFRISESRTSAKAKSIREFMPSRSRGVLVKYLVTSVLIATGAGLFVPLMTQWFTLRYNVPDTYSGPIIGISGFLLAAFALGAPNLARRFGLVRAIVLTQGLSMVFMLAVPLSPTFEIAGGIYILRTFMMNVSGPLGTSLIMGLVDRDERGAAAGISAAMSKLPNSLSTVVGSAMMNAGMLELPFYIASVLYSVSIFMFWIFFRRLRVPEEAERMP